MKKFNAIAAAVLFGIGAVVAGTTPAAAQRDRDGQQRWIEVVNRSNTTIREFYMTDRDTQNWGDDRLGRDVVAPGRSMRVLPTAQQRARGYCVFDMKIVFENNREVERRGVNLCTASELTCASTSSCSVR